MKEKDMVKRPSSTAERTALIRAIESIKPDEERICYGPCAVHFINLRILEFAICNPARYNAKSELGLANSVVARSRYFDDIVKASLKEGIEQLVIIGAGYDARAYYIEGLKNIKVFEVDHPNTQSLKVEKINEIFGSIPHNVGYVPVDLEKDNLKELLVENSYEKSRKTLFLMEGLIMYLSPDVVDKIMSFIAGSDRGNRVVFDYGTSKKIVDKPKSDSGKNIWNYTKKQGELLKFCMEEPVETFLAERGFCRIKNMTSGDYIKAYFHGKNKIMAVSDLLSFAYAVVE
jgi:methyltransferase (TIGR00027 family)